MKKRIITIIVLSILLTGCKKEEYKCPEIIKETIITYNGEELTKNNLLDLYNDEAINELYYKIVGDLVKKELPDKIIIQ